MVWAVGIDITYTVCIEEFTIDEHCPLCQHCTPLVRVIALSPTLNSVSASSTTLVWPNTDSIALATPHKPCDVAAYVWRIDAHCTGQHSAGTSFITVCVNGGVATLCPMNLSTHANTYGVRKAK